MKQNNRYVTRVRGGLIALLIRKEHYLTETEAKKSAAITLMSTDIDGITTGIPKCLEIPFGLVEIGLGMYVLSRFINISALAIFGPLVMSTAAAYLIQRPLMVVLETFPRVTSMLACFPHIQNFLQLVGRRDPRTKRSASVPNSRNTRDVPPDTRAAPGPILAEESIGGLAQSTESPVRFAHADIAPRGMRTPLLRGVDFELSRGSITGMLGTTGSGKSTIMQGVLGQIKVLAGSVHVDANEIRYCGENVWLQNTTIRENIIGDLEFELERFNRVIRVGFLEEDLAWLPGGADYIVGTNGSNLSGGQRQRIGIARTAYAECPVTVLDDSFSSLDRDTAVCILHHPCGRNGIFRQAGCTVLVVTYLPECLDLVDQLLAVDGQVCGMLQDRDAILQYGQRIVAALNILNRNLPTSEEKKAQGTIRRSLDGEAFATELSSAEVRQKGNLRLYLLFIDPIGRVTMALYALFVSLFAAGEVLPEIYIRIWIQVDPENALFFIGYASIAIATCLIGCLVYWLLHTKLSPRASRQLHEQLVYTTIGSTLYFLSTTKVGMLLNRYSQDMTLLSRNLPGSLLYTVQCGTNAVIQIGIILSGATYFTAILPAVLAALYFIQRYYLRTSRQVRFLDLETKAPLYTYFEETAAGLTHIQAFNWESQNIARGVSLLEESQKPFYVMLAIQQWLGMVPGLLTALLGTLLVALALFIRQRSSPSAVGLSFMGLVYLSVALENTIEAWTTLETSSSALSRLKMFTESTPQEINQSTVQLPPGWPSNGSVAFRNVYVHYARASRPALRNASLRVQPGQRIVIAGRSGSGKSTLLLAMLGFIEYDGSIEIDGIDVSTVSCEDLRSCLVTITQDQVRFDASIRTNLLPLTMNNVRKGSAEEEEKALLLDNELEQLLKSLHIWMPLVSKAGLDTMLDDVGYSKGQIQLLCIARAILKQRETGCKLVLIDEATSSVDASTEQIAHRVMREHFAGCTVLTIAHRRSNLTGVDSVINLQRGVIVHPDGLRSHSESSEESNYNPT